jgi:hypothetical protein
MVWTARVNRQAIRQFGAGAYFSGGVGHGIELLKPSESIPKAKGFFSFCLGQVPRPSSMDKVAMAKPKKSQTLVEMRQHFNRR